MFGHRALALKQFTLRSVKKKKIVADIAYSTSTDEQYHNITLGKKYSSYSFLW